MLGHSWHRVHGLWPNGLRHHPCKCRALIRWHRLSISHHLAGQQLRTNRRYSHQASLPGGESLLTPLLIRIPPLVVKAWRTVGDRGLGAGRQWPICQLPQGSAREDEYAATSSGGRYPLRGNTKHSPNHST